MLANLLDRSVRASESVSQKWTKDAYGKGALSPRGSGGECQGNGRMWRVAHLGGVISQRAAAGDESILEEVSYGSLLGTRVEGGPYLGCGVCPQMGEWMAGRSPL